MDNEIKFFKTHNACVSYKNNWFTDEMNTAGYIYLVRDPRDVAISSVHWMDREKGNSHLFKAGKISKSNWDLISFDKKLIKVIKNSLNSQYEWFYRIYQKNYSNVLLVRFENLIGEQGGGSDLSSVNENVDIVDMFRPSKEAPQLVEEAIKLGA